MADGVGAPLIARLVGRSEDGGFAGGDKELLQLLLGSSDDAAGIKGCVQGIMPDSPWVAHRCEFYIRRKFTQSDFEARQRGGKRRWGMSAAEGFELELKSEADGKGTVFVASEGVIRIPAGTWIVTQTIDLPAGVTLKGEAA